MRIFIEMDFENNPKMQMKQIVINFIEDKEEIVKMMESTLGALEKISYDDNERIESLANTYIMESKRAQKLGVDTIKYDNKYSGLREIILHPGLVN